MSEWKMDVPGPLRREVDRIARRGLTPAEQKIWNRQAREQAKKAELSEVAHAIALQRLGLVQ